MNSEDRASNPDPADHMAQAGALRISDVFPAARLLGPCIDCRSLIFDRDLHEWATRGTRRLCLPYDDGAALYCDTCSGLRPDA